MQNPNNLSMMMSQIKNDLEKSNTAYKQKEELIRTNKQKEQTLEKSLIPKKAEKKKKEDAIRKETQEIQKIGTEIAAIETNIANLKTEEARAVAEMGAIRLNLLRKQAELKRIDDEYTKALKSSAVKS
ncbi:MAG: hypothetical protein V4526_02345 [Patescibacteria group bacterium]